MTPEQPDNLFVEQRQVFDELTQTMRVVHEGLLEAPQEHVDLHQEAFLTSYQRACDYLIEQPELAKFYQELGAAAVDKPDLPQLAMSIEQLEGYVEQGLIDADAVEAVRAEFTKETIISQIAENRDVFEELFGRFVEVEVVPEATKSVRAKVDSASEYEALDEEALSQLPPHRNMDKNDSYVLSNLKISFQLDCILRYALNHEGPFRLEEIHRDLAFLKNMPKEEYAVFRNVTWPAMREQIVETLTEEGYRPIWIKISRNRGRRYQLATLIDEAEAETPPGPISNPDRSVLPKFIDARPVIDQPSLYVPREPTPEKQEKQAFLRAARFTEKLGQSIEEIANGPEQNSDRVRFINQKVAIGLGITTEESQDLLDEMTSAELMYKNYRDGAAILEFSPPDNKPLTDTPPTGETDTKPEDSFSEIEQKAINEIFTHLSGRDVTRGESIQNLLRLVQDRLQISIEPEDFKVLVRKIIETPYFIRASRQYKGRHLLLADQQVKNSWLNGDLKISDEFPQLKVKI